jgi:hypothetical protein
MENGVLTVSEKHGETVEVAIVNGELEVFGDVIVEEIELEDGVEELIGFPEEPDMPTNSKAHLVDRVKPYPLIQGLKVGDKVRLRLDLDIDMDDITEIGLRGYYDMLEDLSERDILIERIDAEYDEISDTNEDCLFIEDWYLSTRWVTECRE